MDELKYEGYLAAKFAEEGKYPSFAEYERCQHLYRFKRQSQIDELRRIWETSRPRNRTAVTTSTSN
jgi:hypothetical protein